MCCKKRLETQLCKQIEVPSDIWTINCIQNLWDAHKITTIAHDEKQIGLAEIRRAAKVLASIAADSHIILQIANNEVIII